MRLRPYQSAAIEAIRERYRAGDRATLLVMATGLGKTAVFSDAARRTVDRGGRVLVVAHRGELLEQAAAKLRAVGVEPAIEKAEQRAGDAPVVVASVQSLRGQRLAGFDPSAFNSLVVDEAHRAAAPSYRAILDHFTSARVLGVTATPDRLDGLALGEVFDSCAYRYGLRQAILDGWLSPVRARRVRVASLQLDNVSKRRGDFLEGELAPQLGAERALHEVVAPLVELTGDRPTIVFAVDVAHAEQLAAMINRYRPGAACAVSGLSPADERRCAVEEFRAGAFQYLVNCQLFAEGFDAPEVACIAVARPTMSRALYSQMVGRGTRLARGKVDCLVLDFVGATRHRLASAAAVLAGADVDAAIAGQAAEMSASEDVDVLEALECAADEVAAQRQTARVRAVATFMAEQVDPFIGATRPPDAPWVSEAATAEQRAALERAGLQALPEALKGEAFAILEELNRRWKLGLASYKQRRLLARHGIDGGRMSKAEASNAIGRLLARFRARA